VVTEAGGYFVFRLGKPLFADKLMYFWGISGDKFLFSENSHQENRRKG
jgi:hypothetical protein